MSLVNARKSKGGCGNCYRTFRRVCEEDFELLFRKCPVAALITYEEYVNNITPFPALCVCRKEIKVTWKSLLRGSRCRGCAVKTRETTCLRRYGKRNVMQFDAIFEKHNESCHSKKTYIFPSGNVATVMGYEPFAINKLLAMGFSEAQIVTSPTGIPQIPYTDPWGVERIYYPDIMVRCAAGDFVIEVKSDYTYDQDTDLNAAKWAAARDVCNFRVWSFEEDGSFLRESDNSDGPLPDLDAEEAEEPVGKMQCSQTTTKGTQCRKICQPGESVCELHKGLGAKKGKAKKE